MQSLIDQKTTSQEQKRIAIPTLLQTSGRLFHIVQISRLYYEHGGSSKTFVDAELKLNKTEEAVSNNFLTFLEENQPLYTKVISHLEASRDVRLSDIKDEEVKGNIVEWQRLLRTWVAQHFDLPTGTEQKTETQSTSTLSEQKLWPSITQHCPRVLNTSLKVHVTTDQKAIAIRGPQHSSRIPLPNDSVIAGSRYRECYYWDSYFTSLGLAQQKDFKAIENLIKNFMFLQTSYGRIPNANRTYYSDRSQPPVLFLMVQLLLENKKQYEITPEFKREMIEAIKVEHAYWMKGERSVKVPKAPNSKECYILNRYWSDENPPTPRPESYVEDYILGLGKTKKEKEELYRHIRAAAESGWDFSSRWLKDPEDLGSIKTTDILPIDLNALLFGMEEFLAQNDSDSKQGETYQAQANSRKEAILALMWNQKTGFFSDYNWRQGQPTSIQSLAGTIPLFVNMLNETEAEQVISVAQEQKLFLRSGGMIATLTPMPKDKKNQLSWDNPTGWPSSHLFVVQGLLQYGFVHEALSIINTWNTTIENFYQKNHVLMERYNMLSPMEPAPGGEYPSQEGFGWTIGVYLRFIELKQLLDRYEQQQSSSSQRSVYTHNRHLFFTPTTQTSSTTLSSTQLSTSSPSSSLLLSQKPLSQDPSLEKLVMALSLLEQQRDILTFYLERMKSVDSKEEKRPELVTYERVCNRIEHIEEQLKKMCGTPHTHTADSSTNSSIPSSTSSTSFGNAKSTFSNNQKSPF